MNRQSVDSGSESRPGAVAAPTSKRLSFKVIMMGEIRDEDGVHFGLTHYKASDGVGLALIHNEFPSEAAGQKYLEKVVQRATKIIKLSKKEDKAGKLVGERAQLIVRTGRSNETTSAILWTFGTHFYEIKSTSFSDSEKLEKLLTN